MKFMSAGLVATMAAVGISVMAGCTSGQLAGAMAAATGGTNGAISTGGQACTNATPSAAAAPTTATKDQGDYVGETIPNGWDTAYKDQAALDAGFTNLKASNPNAWTTAKCIYQPALETWAKNTNQTP